MRYAPEHKARTRERVLKAAVLAIRAGGLESVGVAEVMKRAGLTHGGFYAHFASRDALLKSALEDMFSSAAGEFERRTEGLDAAEALRTYVRFYVSRAHRDATGTGCPLPVLSNAGARLDPEERERFASAFADLAGKIAGKLERLGRAGAHDLAGSALAEMIGALTVSRAIGATPPSDLVLSNTRAAVLARFGLSTR